MQTAVDEDRQFVLDTLWYSQRVQVSKKWHYALEPLFREDQTWSIVQDRLQLVEHVDVAWRLRLEEFRGPTGVSAVAEALTCVVCVYVLFRAAVWAPKLFWRWWTQLRRLLRVWSPLTATRLCESRWNVPFRRFVSSLHCGLLTSDHPAENVPRFSPEFSAIYCIGLNHSLTYVLADLLTNALDIRWHLICDSSLFSVCRQVTNCMRDFVIAVSILQAEAE